MHFQVTEMSIILENMSSYIGDGSCTGTREDEAEWRLLWKQQRIFIGKYALSRDENMEHATSQNWLRTTSFPKNFKEEQKISD